MSTGTAFGAKALLICLLASGLAAAAPGEETPRTSTTKHYVAGAREGRAPTAVSQDRYGALATGGVRAQPGKLQVRDGKPAESTLQSTGNNDFWFFAADVVLFGDDDRDGFFYGIDLVFDADTIFEAADVYAVLYLSLEGGPWNEYATTEDFTIFAAISDDEFGVVTELESGYPRGSYDILIELYDAFDGTFLTSIGPADTSELGLLPLEDFERDAPDRHHHHHTGGGAVGFPLLALLAFAAALRRKGNLRRSSGRGGRRARCA